MTGGGVLIDIPQLAYKTWLLQVCGDDGNRDLDAEKELEKRLMEYRYNPEHEHIK